MSNLIHSSSYMNTELDLKVLIHPVYEDLSKKAEADNLKNSSSANHRVVHDPAAFVKLRQTYFDLFNKKLRNEVANFNPNKNLFKSIDYICPLRDVLFNLIEKIVRLCLINSPENTPLIEKWNKFREAFALLSYKKDGNLTAKLKQYLIVFQEEVKRSAPPSIHEEVTAFDPAFDLLNKALSRELDFLKVPLAYLTSLEKKDRLEISVEHLITANNFLVDKCLQDLPWVLDNIERRLNLFKDCKQDRVMIFSKVLLSKITNFRQKYLLQIPYLSLKDIRSSANIKIDFLKDLFKEIQAWKEENYGVDFFLGIQNENYLLIHRNHTDAVYSESFYPCAMTLKLLKQCEEDAASIINLKNEQVPKEKQCLMPGLNRTNLEHLRKSIQFHEFIIGCDIYLQTYFYTPIRQLVLISSTIHDWFQNLPPAYQRRVKQKPKDPTPLINSTSGIEKNIEETLKDFEIPKKSSRKRPSKHPNRGTQPSNPQLPSSETPHASQDSSSSLVQSPSSIPLHDKMVHLLNRMIQKMPQTPSKESLMHAHMYLQDLIVAHEALQKTSNHSARLFYLITNIHSAYFTIEQLMSYLGKGEFQNHNLINLMNMAKLESIIKNKDLIHDLFLANYWIRQPYVQLTKRKSWSIPPVLNTVIEIYESQNFSSIPNTTIAKIKSYIRSIPEFAFNIVKEEENIQYPEKRNIGDFQPEMEFEKEKIQLILKRCESLLERIPSYFQDKFKQVILHIKMIEGITHELSHPTIPSNQFGFLIRQLIFWENTVIEEILESLHFLKTGEDFISHHLETLWNKIPWKEPKEKDRTLLSRFQNIHNISRYPHSQHPKELDEFHHIILRGEQLRSMPELGSNQPFSLVKSRTENIPVNLEELTPKEIGLKLQTLTHKILSMIEKRVLPEFETLTQ